MTSSYCLWPLQSNTCWTPCQATSLCQAVPFLGGVFVHDAATRGGYARPAVTVLEMGRPGRHGCLPRINPLERPSTRSILIKYNITRCSVFAMGLSDFWRSFSNSNQLYPLDGASVCATLSVEL
ncbi:hypothetical protein FA95DRAFT_927120 [Auriscalpium vulgare]|uniref:Uncharacterized protein n=1 Tax=Auriscalpium vulgare TaxID=40419 RepID=A0ACB8R7J3_9AGAM|nr:hypothetical protein FA95DRAFT_927120 [Auriscalpium vulgare]